MRATALRGLAAAAAIAAALAAGAVAHASDPVGIYAIVEKVVFEPDEKAPVRVQVWGAFAQADSRNNNDEYGPAAAGYLYFTCPAGREQVCRNEWSDLKSMAGQGVGVAFGGRFEPASRVRKTSEPPASPDPYPIRMGVVKMSDRGQQPALVARLKAALAVR
jgi:hypothetical protein